MENRTRRRGEIDHLTSEFFYLILAIALREVEKKKEIDACVGEQRIILDW